MLVLALSLLVLSLSAEFFALVLAPVLRLWALALLIDSLRLFSPLFVDTLAQLLLWLVLMESLFDVTFAVESIRSEAERLIFSTFIYIFSISVDYWLAVYRMYINFLQ